MSTIIDLTTNHNQVENNGVITVDDAGKFPGTKALYFDGSSYMTFPAAAASINSFPACIEAWVKPENVAATEITTDSYGIITKGRYNIKNNHFGLYWKRRERWRSDIRYTPADDLNSFSLRSFSIANRASANLVSSEFLASGYSPEWFHFAVTIQESGGRYWYTCYLNGSQFGYGYQNAYATNGYTNLTSNDSYLTLGAYKSYSYGTYSTSNRFKGYMTDVRLTYGEIIYTENFDPPNQPHPKNY